jgi:hypothetical protein
MQGLCRVFDPRSLACEQVHLQTAEIVDLVLRDPKGRGDRDHE